MLQLDFFSPNLWGPLILLDEKNSFSRPLTIHIHSFDLLFAQRPMDSPEYPQLRSEAQHGWRMFRGIVNCGIQRTPKVSQMDIALSMTCLKVLRNHSLSYGIGTFCCIWLRAVRRCELQFDKTMRTDAPDPDLSLSWFCCNEETSYVKSSTYSYFLLYCSPVILIILVMLAFPRI